MGMGVCGHKVLSLDGVWNLGHNKVGKASYEEGINQDVIPCVVPGDVHLAFLDAGVIKDPAFGLNSKECAWMEEEEFWYQREFDVEEGFLQDDTTLLFGGLDLTADIWLNGTFLGRNENAFVEIELNVTQIIKTGTNHLVVRIDQGLESEKNKDLQGMGEMWNHDQPYRAWMRKPQYVYGWDWTIWLPSCGIWKSVELHSKKKAGIKNLHIFDDLTGLNNQMADGVTVPVCLETEICNYSQEEVLYLGWICKTDARFGKEEKVFASQWKVEAGKTGCVENIKDASLWWTNETGNPYLYSMEVFLTTADGEVLDHITLQHGIRKIEIWEKPLNEKEKSFTFALNEEPIFCKGVNHVPMDCLPGRVTKEKTAKQITMAKEAHMNMIRVWGGGIYESDEFFAQCDQDGIMVWHDFMFACGYHPDFDREFMDNVEREATLALLRTRNHACLIGWSGNNEIQEMYIATKTHKPELPWYGGSIYETLLPELMEKYTKNMIYRESSPYGDPKDPSGFDIGDQHIWHFTHRPQYEHFMDLWRYTDFNLKFLSEFGIIGTMNVNSTKKSMAKEDLNPDSEAWLFHSNNSSDHQLLNMVMNAYFGDYKKFTLGEYIVRSQVIQAEITRHIYDEFQRRKFVCSGLLFWTMGDSIGIHNWSLVDYYMQKKPVYDYLKRSMNPLKLFFKGYEGQNSDGMKHYREYFAGPIEDLSIWIGNDYLCKKEVTVAYRLLRLDGTVVKEYSVDVTAKKNSSEEVLVINFDDVTVEPEEMVIVAEILERGEVIHENHYFFAPYDKINVKKANVEMTLEQLEEDRYELTFSTDTFVWMMHMEQETDMELSDNNFDLVPGVERKVTIRGNNVSTEDIMFYAMNELALKMK